MSGKDPEERTEVRKTGTISRARVHERVKTMRMLAEKKNTRYQAAMTLGRSIKQIGRLLKSYLELGEEGLAHKLCGKPSNHCKDDERKREVLVGYLEHYAKHSLAPILAAYQLKE
ncbi:MAG: hypothetical protein LBG06_01565, partial [Deltaproteobacteria bacterium]|nr:hypothetical protein [Deltaproteobacteria bacterium]